MPLYFVCLRKGEREKENQIGSYIKREWDSAFILMLESEWKGECFYMFESWEWEKENQIGGYIKREWDSAFIPIIESEWEG